MKNHPFTNLFRTHDKRKNSISIALTFYFGTSGFGKSFTAQAAIQLSTVCTCVRGIAGTVTSLYHGVYENSVKDSSKAQDHPLYPLLPDRMNVDRDKTGIMAPMSRPVTKS